MFVGRHDELNALTGAFARVTQGLPATVLIDGEAGIGKSRLVDEFAARVTGRVLRGGCLDLDVPFAPFTAVLRRLVGELGAAGVSALLPGRDAGELARLLPALGPLPGASELARARLFEQFLTLLAGLAEREHVVLVIEDAHWADRSTRDLLGFLVRNQHAAPGLLLLVTYRSDQVDRANPLRPLLAELARVEWTRQLAPRRLTRPEVTAQLRGLLGHQPDPALTERIHRRAEGNPLFVEALLGSPGDPLPESLRDLLLEPVERLPEPSRAAVRAAAVGGVRTGHLLLAEVTGLDDAALRPATGAKVLLVDGDDFVFRHALIREAVLADLLPGERSALHVRYADALQRRPELAPPGRAALELAHHWYAVAQQHGARALSAAWRAAADAGVALAPAEQLRVLTHVLELWDRVPDAAGQLGTDHLAVLEAAIGAAAAAGEGERALELITTAFDAGPDPARLARILLHRGELRHALGLPGDLADLREAARLGPADPAVLTTLASRLLMIPRDEEGRAVCRQALDAAHAAGDERAAVLATIDLTYVQARAGDLDNQLPRLAEAAATAERLGDHTAVLHARRRTADLLQDFGRHEEADAAGRRGLAAAARAGLSRTAGPIHAGNRAEALISLGRWDEALEILEHALEPAPTPSLRAYLLVLRATIGLARGDLAQAEEVAGHAHQVFFAGTCYAQDFLLLTRFKLDLLLAQGRRAEAVHRVERSLSNLDPEETSSRYLWPVLAAAARATGPGGLVQFGTLAATLPVIGPVQLAHKLTLDAELSADLDSWDRCVRAWADVAQPYSVALALLRAAEIAAEAGDRDAVADRLLRAADAAAPLAAPPLRADIDRLARLARVSLVPQHDPPNGHRHGLTPRELEVLRLLADGRTNREIAAELFISVKTASVHVSNILAKLGVTGRVQAATAAHRLDLLTP